MNSKTRPSAAAIGAAILSRKKIKAIYCYTTGTWCNIEAELIGVEIKAYDYGRACFVEGNLPSSVYDYGTSSFLEFKLGSGKIDGYDYASSSFFEIKMSGSSLEFYDYADGKFHNFGI